MWNISTSLVIYVYTVFCDYCTKIPDEDWNAVTYYLNTNILYLVLKLFLICVIMFR